MLLFFMSDYQQQLSMACKKKSYFPLKCTTLSTFNEYSYVIVLYLEASEIINLSVYVKAFHDKILYFLFYILAKFFFNIEYRKKKVGLN